MFSDYDPHSTGLWELVEHFEESENINRCHDCECEIPEGQFVCNDCWSIWFIDDNLDPTSDMDWLMRDLHYI